MKKYRLCVLTAWLLLGLPAAAQYNQNHKAVNEKFTPTQKGTPGYYDHNARLLFKQGKWAEGKKLLDEGMEKYGYLSALNELMGNYWMHCKQYDRARYYYIRSLRDNDDNLQAKEQMMKLEELTKHYSTAIVYCNELLEASPYNYRLWRKKIELYRLQGDHVEATRLLQRLNAIYPGKAEVKKEMLWDYEQKYRQYRAKKNLVGQEEMLKKLVELDPKNEEFQMALCNLLLQTGRTEQAMDVAGYAATMVRNPYPFVEKKASILGGMTRYSEALSYLRSVKRSMPGVGAHLGRITNNLEQEAAQAAVANDPYTAYARLYERTHSNEALTYLLNTSMSRGYLDDALTYIREARRRKGDSEKLMLSEYTVQRRMGNTKAATSMLERIHNKYPHNQDVNEELCSIRLDEIRRMMDLEQYDEALIALSKIRNFKVDSEMSEAIEQRIFTCYAKTGQREKAIQQLARLGKSEEMSAQLYEEIQLPYIKQLLQQGRLYQAETELQKLIDKGYPSSDVVVMGINVAMQLKKNDKARSLVDMGKNRYPEEPLFILKEAQLKASEGDYETAMPMLRQMLETYVADTAVVNAYADCSETLAMKQLKDKNYDEALRLIDEAMQYAPNNQSLILSKAMVYEGQKDWAKAMEIYKLYRPSIAELPDYYRHLETLKRHAMLNEVTIDYQSARPSSDDHISSMALVSYTRIGKKNNYTFGFGYAARDGSVQSANPDELGGTGVQLSGEWQHAWNNRLTTNLIAGWANKFFPRLRAELKGSYEMPKDWIAKAGLSYRLIGNDASTSLIGLGLGATKELERFSLGTDLHLLAMSGGDTNYFGGNFFVNGSVIAKCYPIEDSRTHLYATGSVGNAPEISLIDNLMPVKFNQLNTMLGLGGIYTVNSMIELGLSGQWYLMSVKKETESNNNKNYLYLNAHVTIHF